MVADGCSFEQYCAEQDIEAHVRLIVRHNDIKDDLPALWHSTARCGDSESDRYDALQTLLSVERVGTKLLSSGAVH